MTALPKTVLQEVGCMIAPSKSTDMKTIMKRFAYHGYGPKKIEKWVYYYQTMEILQEQDDGSYTCVLW